MLITMSNKEIQRLAVLQDVRDGKRADSIVYDEAKKRIKD